MKFSQAQLGTRAERPISFEIRGVECSFALRPLTATEDGLVLSRATDYAKAKNAAKLEPGNALFDLGIMLHSLAIACVDIDSPKESREAFFDKGAEQVSDALDTEQVAFLYARYELWQSECSPSRGKLTGEEMVRTLVEIVGSDSDLPLVRLRPGVLATLLRTTARLLLGSPAASSLLSSLSNGTPIDSTSP